MTGASVRLTSKRTTRALLGSTTLQLQGHDPTLRFPRPACLPDMNDATRHIARSARLRLLWLRVGQLDALYDLALAKGRLIKAMRLARLGARVSREYLES